MIYNPATDTNANVLRTKMYKDRLRKWGIAKNIKTSDINTLELMNHSTIKHSGPPPLTPSPEHHQHQSPDQQQQPEFFVVGSRVVRFERLQQALQRRAAVARRATMKNDPRQINLINVNASDSIPPFLVNLPGAARRMHHRPLAPTSPTTYQPLAPETFRIPEQILQNSHAFIQGLFDFPSSSSPSSSALISLRGPIQTLHLTFEETIGNLTQLRATPQRTRLAFQSLDTAFALLRPCLTSHDPQFLLILTQLLALCVYSRRLEIMGMLLGYLQELTAVVLGAGHPLTRVCRDLRTMAMVTRKRKRGGGGRGGGVGRQGDRDRDEEEEEEEAEAAAVEEEDNMLRRMNDICKIVAEACWRLFRAHLYPHPHLIDDVFVHLTAAYGDVLDSVGREDENEAFLRYVVEEMMMSPQPPPSPSPSPPPHPIPPDDNDDNDDDDEGTNTSLSSAPSPPSIRASSSPVSLDRRIRMEMHLVLALRRRGKFPEALTRLHRIRAEIAQLSSHNEDDDNRIAELTYEVLRLSGLCEIGRGELVKGRALHWEAFELMQAKRGKYHPRTTRALRDCVRWEEQGSPGQEGLLRELEERLARFSLEGEGLLS